MGGDPDRKSLVESSSKHNRDSQKGIAHSHPPYRLVFVHILFTNFIYTKFKYTNRKFLYTNEKFIHLYVYTYVSTRMCVSIYIYVYIHIYIYTCIYIHICVRVRAPKSIYMSMSCIELSPRDQCPYDDGPFFWMTIEYDTNLKSDNVFVLESNNVSNNR